MAKRRWLRDCFEFSKIARTEALATIAHLVADFSNDFWPPPNRGGAEAQTNGGGERRHFSAVRESYAVSRERADTAKNKSHDDMNRSCLRNRNRAARSRGACKVRSPVVVAALGSISLAPGHIVRGIDSAIAVVVAWGWPLVCSRLPSQRVGHLNEVESGQVNAKEIIAVYRSACKNMLQVPRRACR